MLSPITYTCVVPTVLKSCLPLCQRKAITKLGFQSNRETFVFFNRQHKIADLSLSSTFNFNLYFAKVHLTSITSITSLEHFRGILSAKGSIDFTSGSFIPTKSGFL